MVLTYISNMSLGSWGAVQTLYSSSTPVGGRATTYISDVEVAQDGTILFTDSSARWPRHEQFSILLEGDVTGRLLAYSDTSNKAIVVLNDLAFPNGLQLGPNDDYLLITETGKAKILKLGLKRSDGSWLKLSDFTRYLPGLPDNIRASGRGTYWVAFSQARHHNMSSMVDEYANDLQMRKIIAKEQIKSMTDKYGIVAELDGDGKIIRTFQDPTGLKEDSISEAHEHEGYLYLGSTDDKHISRVLTTRQFNVERFLAKLKSTCRATKINVDRLRMVLRRLIAIAELRRALLAAQRRREEAEARLTTTVAPETSDSTSSAFTTTTALVTDVSATSSTSAQDSTTQAATATTQGQSSATTTTAGETITAAASTSAATTATTVTAAATESTTVDEETGGGIVEDVTEAPTTAAQTSAPTTSVTDSTAQASTDATTAAATTASGTAETTADSTTAASTAAQTSDSATTSSATDATTDSSATTMSTSATT
ncbi:adipocyte plasma membrane-associated protein [Elysia marginata]|uniref:Adipocyte plasma membrane-associated protein n=1 Tax=Elysia marginata TaxID=1093978 RepID=A0AAV4K270_9GAST|nr:adipocyte plasma membrane-associated protein [Elysia marginata]